MGDRARRWGDGRTGGTAACAFGVIAVLTLAAAGGCASKGPDPDVDMQELLQMLPGHYDNTAQVHSDAERGVRPPHEALTLDIVPVDAPMIGDHVFYAQESAADDPRRIMGQKVMVFAVVRKDIVETDFSLGDPHRWRNGQRNPDLFKSLMTQDVGSSKGCSLRWKRSEGHFVGANEAKTCHGVAGGGSGMTQIDSRAELQAEEYATAVLAYDRPGHLARGRQDEPFYRFRKQSRDLQDSESPNSRD